MTEPDTVRDVTGERLAECQAENDLLRAKLDEVSRHARDLEDLLDRIKELAEPVGTPIARIESLESWVRRNYDDARAADIMGYSKLRDERNLNPMTLAEIVSKWGKPSHPSPAGDELRPWGD